MKKKLLVCALMLTFAFTGCSASNQNTTAESAASNLSDASAAESAAAEEAETAKPAEISEAEKADKELKISDKTVEEGKPSDFVKIGDYKQLQVTYPDGTPAEDGMTANIEFAGTVVGEDAPRDGMTSDSFDLVLGSKSFIDGFEDALIGHKAGETVKFTIPFPKDYGEETLAGKDTDWVVTIHSLSNGSAASAFTDFTGKAEISEFPKDLYDKTTAYMTEIYKMNAESSGLTLDEFISSNGIDLDSNARQEARNWLVALAVMEAENVTTDSDEYKNTMTNMLQVYGYKSLDAAAGSGMPEDYIHSITARQTAIALASGESAPGSEEPQDTSTADEAKADSSAE